jgi:GTP:adenosylcobinamide-phosphate guanylyltransferase
MEKGQRAYVSYVRAYKEHKCNFIFVFVSHHYFHFFPLIISVDFNVYNNHLDGWVHDIESTTIWETG